MKVKKGHKAQSDAPIDESDAPVNGQKPEKKKKNKHGHKAKAKADKKVNGKTAEPKPKKVPQKKIGKELRRLQIEVALLQQWVRQQTATS